MDFNYKTNFKCGEERQKYIEKTVRNGKFCENKDGVVISKEYPKNEKNNLNSKFYKQDNFKDKKREYYIEVLKLCKNYHSFTNILEVGAGTCFFAKTYINKFKPNSYTIYDSSDVMCKRSRKKLEGKSSTNINIYNNSFKDISAEELTKYDCVIALEVLEHINWDKEFLFSIAPETWIFFSVPRIHSFNHVRAFLTPDSIAYRYKSILDIYEIREVKRDIHFKSKHNYPIHWVVAARRGKNVIEH